MRTAFALAVIGTMLAPAFALADSCCTGFYVSGEAVGGWGMVDDVSSDGTTTGPLTDEDYGDSVAGGGLSMGYDFSYQFGAPVRVEGEFIHIVRLDPDTRPIFSDGTTLQSAGIENNISLRTLMVNVFYDWDLGTWYTPHIGFGVGYGRNRSDADLNNFATGRKTTDETDTDNVAWSLMAGMQFDITDFLPAAPEAHAIADDHPH